MQITAKQAEIIRNKIHLVPPSDKAELLLLLEEFERRKAVEEARKDFLKFIARMNPDYKFGAHLKHLAALLQGVEQGSEERLAVSMAPRFGKSLMLSEYFPAWFIGNNPNKKMIIASHTGDLAIDFGRKVRNLIATDKYQEIFPNVQLSADSKSAGRWTTNHGGDFFATGVGGALAGRGADLLVIDDAFSEQDILAGNFDVFDKVYQWYAYGARTRLMPGGRVVILHTRWALHDLIGRLLVEQGKQEDGDKWHYVEFPAILNEDTDNEKSLWPEQWSLASLRKTRAAMPAFQWKAQYQQAPTAGEGTLLKKEWFKYWEKDDPPKCEYTIMALDAAQEKTERSDYTAITVWGVFYENDINNEPKAKIILLNAVNKRVEFPELKTLALKQYREWKPDTFIIEKKSNGAALSQELRRTGIPLTDYTPSRASAATGPNNKYARVNAITDIVSSGMVYVPKYRWADDLVEQACAFPNDQHDDLLDTMVMALTRFRTGGFITLPSDDDYDDGIEYVANVADYYRV